MEQIKGKIRPFSIGERVWDDEKNTWATISVIKDARPGGFTTEHLKEESVIMLTDGHTKWDQIVDNIYKIVPKKTFHGFPICYEHHETEFGYPYYCPDREQNCWENEIVLNI